MSLLGILPMLSIRTRFRVSRQGRARLTAALSVVAVSCAAPSMVPSSTPAPARPAPGAPRDYSRVESEVLAALNVARTNPTPMAGQLQQLEPYFTGMRFKRPSWPIAVQTVEGVVAVREAVSAVRGQRPVPALTLSASLTRAARDHAVDLARTGNTGHTGSDGSTTATRVARYGTWQISLSENIDFAPMVHGRDVIESLLIDDGVRDRGHRRNIYDASARLVGIACGPHPKFTASCVIVQAGGMIPK